MRNLMILIFLALGLIVVPGQAVAMDIYYADLLITPNNDTSVVGGYLGGDGNKGSGFNDWLDWSIGNKNPFGSSVTDDMVFSTNVGDFLNPADWVERMRITKDGKVGIGTASPIGQLDVVGGGNTRLRVIDSPNGQGVVTQAWYDGANIDPIFDGGNLYLGRETLWSNIFIQSGNVGIGTTSTTQKLDVIGNVVADGFSLSRDNDNRGALWFATAGDFNVSLYNNNSNIDGEGGWDGIKMNFVDGFDIGYRDTGGRVSVMKASRSGNVGIGTTGPNSKLQVKDGDVYVETVGSGIILHSPNGSCFRVTVNDDGSFASANITCP